MYLLEFLMSMFNVYRMNIIPDLKRRKRQFVCMNETNGDLEVLVFNWDNELDSNEWY